MLDLSPAYASTGMADRVARSVALVRRRGYALKPARLGELCLGGSLSEADVRWAAAASPGLAVAGGLVVERGAEAEALRIGERAAGHAVHSARYMEMAREFVASLVSWAPFVRSVWIAGSLASGGFRESDDVDLNIVVDDGHRHLAYVAVNVLGILHALRHRSKPVDDLTRRPVAPRLMTANLILETSQLAPLARTDEGMAFELLMSEPVYGVDVFQRIVDTNPRLLDQFPQLADKQAPYALRAEPRCRVPSWLFPSQLDGAARAAGSAAWRYMQWTRRDRPEALARVAFVRETMRPYTLFDEAPR